MQVWDNEAASIHERENAKAVKRAIEQAVIDQPDVEVTEAILHSRTDPLSDTNLRIKGPRWYVKVNTHNGNDRSKAQTLYRVWRSEREWKAAQV